MHLGRIEGHKRMTKRFDKIAVAVMMIALGFILGVVAHAAWRYALPTPKPVTQEQEPVTYMYIIPPNPDVERLNNAELAAYRAKVLRDDPDAARIMRVKWKDKGGCHRRKKTHCS